MLRLGQAAFWLVLLTSYQRLAHGAETVLVTCGSTIKLKHVPSPAFRLHSHQVSYSRGSGQQSVTAFPSSDDGQSHWSVSGLVDAPCPPGTPLKKGSKLRLQHVHTRKWLHSHQFFSPISGGLEVSAYGDDDQSDGGDVWTVTWDGKGKYWRQDQKVRLQHVDTSSYLSSNEQYQFGHPISGQQEVAGVMSKSKNCEWAAAEGVYYPRNDRPAAGDAAAAAAEGGAPEGGDAADEGRDEL